MSADASDYDLLAGDVHQPERVQEHAECVVTGQRLMQASSDIFLGWLHIDAGWVVAQTGL